jgi:outer membrane protein
MRTRLFATVIALSAVVTVVHAADSKIGYVSSEAIMQQLPEAQDAQKQLDAIVADWQAELAKMQTDLQKRFDDYDKKKLTMSDERRAEAERKIQELDRAMVDYRTKKFGTSGELYLKTNELMKPIQDKIFKAIKDIADEEGYDYVFDKSSTTLLMFANEKNDLTSKVVAKLQQK